MELELVREHSLQPGEMLSWYRIERVLGHGGFGITYLAHDTNLDQPVAIKEYLPTSIAGRLGDRTVRPLSDDCGDTFTWGLERFIAEARILARFNHPNIVRVFAVFEANNTAYMVMEFERGCDFKRYLERPNANTEENLKTMLALIIDGLQKVHELGFIHRDIKPANIYIRDDGSPTLLDFGSARKALGGRTQTLTSLVSVGYTPLEQYSDSSNGDQGPWTDIYALGAVLYYSIAGKPPTDSTRRGSAVVNGSTDPLPKISDIARGRYSEPFLQAIDWALSFAVADRPRDLQAWRGALFAPAAAVSRPDPRDESDRTVLAPRTRRPERVPLPPVEPVEEDAWELGATSGGVRPTRAARPATNERKPLVRAGVAIAGVVASVLAAAGYFLVLRSSPLPEPVTIDSPVGDAAIGEIAIVLPTGVDRPLPAVVPATSAPATTEALLATEALAGTDVGAPESVAAPRVRQMLANLEGAVGTVDIEAVRAGSSISPTTARLLDGLFRNFTTMNVSVPSSALQPTALGFRSTLTIRDMTRATGVSAVPADSYRQLALQIRREAAGGYTIHW